MDPKQIANRGVNFFATAFLSLVSIGSLIEIFMEHELNDRIDDLLIVILAVVLLFWYNKASNAFKRSIVPGIMFILIIIAQVIGLAIEHDDSMAVGPNMGFIILFVIGFVTYLWAYKKHNRLT